MTTILSLLFYHVLSSLDQSVMMWLINTLFIHAAEIPLYPGATISCRESWSSIYKFSVTNRLSDSATQNLLKLISSHCPTPNLCPQTVYKLKKQVGPLDCIRSQYCSLCMNEVPPDEKKCGSCKGQSSHVCYYVLMPFEEHLKEIFSGKHIYVTMVT